MTTAANPYVERVLANMPRATPQRAQIEMELRSVIAERLGHGQSLDEVIRQLGDPDRLAESYLAAVPLVPASFWLRGVAKVVDALALAVATTPIGWVIGRLGGEFPFLDIIVVLVLTSLLFGFYVAIAEWYYGETVGKHLFGLRVVRESGARIGFGQALVRQLPLWLEVFWIDVLFALFTERKQRAFELLSKTRVVRSGPAAAM
jgi:uncharacterized RDD family membrane protein YckC